MKLDMHCHVKEGSIDSKVGLEEYIDKLIDHGYDGMVVTDHDTYNGYRYWKNELKGKKYQDFIVFKGIEYDTRDAGHFLVIMPEGRKMRLLEMRGLPLAMLIDLVHKNGGVLGPAHPCGEKYLSFTNTKRFYKSPELIKRFDFIEVFNVSTAYTEFSGTAACETELINLIRKNQIVKAGGRFYDKTVKDKIGKANKLLAYSFWFYNKGGELLKRRSRQKKMKVESPVDPIDPIEIPYLREAKKEKMQKLKD